MTSKNTNMSASLVFIFILLFCAIAIAAPDFQSRLGTIRHALLQSDGTAVSLDAVMVDKIRAKQEPAYFTAREGFNAKDRIVILTPPSPELGLGMSVDIEGIVNTLPNGCRAITDVKVYGYADKNGSLLQNGPLPKGLIAPTPWERKVDLTVESKADALGLVSRFSYEPNTNPSQSPTYYANISDAASGAGILTDGDFIQLAEFECKPILSVGVDPTYGNYFIMGEDSGPDTLKVYYQTAVADTSRVNRVSGQLREQSGGQVLCVNSGPGYNPQLYKGSLQVAAKWTIAWAKTFSNGTTLPYPIKDKIVSRVFPSAGYFYVQEPTRWGGIRVQSNATVAPGDKVTVSGTIQIQEGEEERKIVASGITDQVSGAEPNPIYVNHRFFGGDGPNEYTPGITGARGTSNTGLLVKVLGRVSLVNIADKYFYMDDGSRDSMDVPILLKVSWNWEGSQDGNPPIAAPEVGWYVAVTGISSSEKSQPESDTIRVLRLREQKDLQVVTPVDGEDPYVSLTSPPGNEIHIASGQSSVQLAGIASDAPTGVTSVQVGFTAMGSGTEPASWSVANYYRNTLVWTFDWTSPVSKRVWIKATDFAHRTMTIYRDITVTSVNVIYVDKDGPNGNGLSWATAKTTVAGGLAIASGKEVWVAEGVYNEDITLNSGIGLYGGFAGNETAREQRNWVTRTCSLMTVGIPEQANSNTVFDGFNIQEISCWQNSSPTISHNIINGIYCDSNASPIITCNVIRKSYYYGILCVSGASPKIVNNTIIENGDAGIYLESVASGTLIANNIIAKNGCGITMVSCDISERIHHNCVYGNGAESDPAGLFDPLRYNITQNPLLEDYYITWNSPCVNAGDNSVVVGDLDIDFQARRNGMVDIGADEWNGPDIPSPTPAFIYVKPSSQGGNDDNNGMRWGSAVATVHRGIHLAYNGGGGEVWVAAGTYDNTHARLRSFVKVYGGFAVGDTSKSDRDWNANPTILDGAYSGSVVTISDVSSCSVDGLTIQNGKGDYRPIISSTGGGIYCFNATATIANNFIRINNAGLNGGGLYASESTLTVAGNVFYGNTAGKGSGIYYVNTGGQIANNTIIYNIANMYYPITPGCAVYFDSSFPTLANNIVGFNKNGGIGKVWGGVSPTFENNNVYGNDGYNYSNISTPPLDISADPKFNPFESGDFHIFWNSPCRDTGSSTVVLPDTIDIDGEPRWNGNIDIGADETTECWRYTYTLTSDAVEVTPSAQVKITAYVHDVVTGQPASGYQVDISVNEGKIVSVTRNGDTITLPAGTQSTYGITGADGKVVAYVTRQDTGLVQVNGSIIECNEQITKTANIRFYNPTVQYRVGFIYDLCENVGAVDSREMINIYLTDIDQKCVDVVYQQITGNPFTIDTSFNIVFLALPDRELQSSEMSALSNFVQSGRNKRIVLVGEYATAYSTFNTRLNNIAAGLGINSRFSTSGNVYDNGEDINRMCAINPNHYLTTGVVNLWDAAVSAFVDGWQAYARPLAYINTAPMLPWILEEDTATAGSRVLIHDSNIMWGAYNESSNPLPDKNFKFIHNLCTWFPE
ncbi:MAG: right-handed parallel beta-helix repeat-containing protein [Armatimonadota bacterium]|nr:right-handed parallel beta-helix repeat-containing protein [Armatimonadota bacterium]